MRVLICGGRNYMDKDHVFKVLDRFHERKMIEFIIEGGASGADKLAKQWAEKNNIDHKTFPALWNDFSEPCVVGFGRHGKYNKLAGGKRNQRMLEEGEPDVVFAFPGGSGTADMVRRAQKSAVPVTKFSPHDEKVDIGVLKTPA